MAYRFKTKNGSMKISKKKLNALIKDEKMATKEYHKLGFHNLAKDEAKHAKFLSKVKNCKNMW